MDPLSKNNWMFIPQNVHLMPGLIKNEQQQNSTKMIPKQLHILPSINNNFHSNKTILVSFCNFGMYLSFWKRKFSLLPSTDSPSIRIERSRTYG